MVHWIWVAPSLLVISLALGWMFVAHPVRLATLILFAALADRFARGFMMGWRERPSATNEQTALEERPG